MAGKKSAQETDADNLDTDSESKSFYLNLVLLVLNYSNLNIFVY